MQTRELGKGGLHVSAQGLGCMGMSEFYGPHDESQSIKVIHRALELGITFLDTADMYGTGHNEQLIGRAIADRRDRVILATKFGNVRKSDGTFVGISGKPEYVQSACEASLKRLKVQVIDLYYQHRVDPQTPIEETVSAMAKLVQQGKVRYLGLSEASAQTIRRAVKVHPIAALQTEYSLWSREVEQEILPTCRELGIGFVAYSPLGRGFLSGKIRSGDDLAPDDWRRKNPRFEEQNIGQNLKIVEGIERIAKQHHVTASQVSLAWVLSRGRDVVPIPGTKRLDYLEQNAAADGVRLDENDLRELDQLTRPGSVAGTRYPEPGMRSVNL